MKLSIVFVAALIGATTANPLGGMGSGLLGGGSSGGSAGGSPGGLLSRLQGGSAGGSFSASSPDGVSAGGSSSAPSPGGVSAGGSSSPPSPGGSAGSAAPSLLGGGSAGGLSSLLGGGSSGASTDGSAGGSTGGSAGAPSAASPTSPGGGAGGKCDSYTIINTRGTTELQGPSVGFLGMNQQLLMAAPGGKQYNTLYPADWSQISTVGTLDIVNKVNSVLRTSPKECFILQGYSQGAAATTNAMPKLTGAAFDAVRGVVLVGNPERQPGKDCNVDDRGGSSTKMVGGMMAMLGGIPANWVPKVLDICIFGDGVCDTTHGFGINPPHLLYGGSSSVQGMGASYMKKALGY
ncbi:uncharacterized protein PFL1_01913 [Pseudozyma flocculosa PF-1]|uniref:Cutinase n=1 Tax=Pseudozyma flocculosa TaxID=84751 RepID=A0A5C3F2D2_9BASI|nr:uncharacterized protein PFL1_01913 [Pseudozyma flocculosa PF-1]EPQ30387.1 hypothetical protein PFL1_01913 [Pseudozyma flocculosa PF-1]SPO37461.1 uncharacterized protein PSFLO_02935 [Pseudozyma flocculosa]